MKVWYSPVTFTVQTCEMHVAHEDRTIQHKLTNTHKKIMSDFRLVREFTLSHTIQELQGHFMQLHVYKQNIFNFLPVTPAHDYRHIPKYYYKNGRMQFIVLCKQKEQCVSP